MSERAAMLEATIVSLRGQLAAEQEATQSLRGTIEHERGTQQKKEKRAMRLNPCGQTYAEERCQARKTEEMLKTTEAVVADTQAQTNQLKQMIQKARVEEKIGSLSDLPADVHRHVQMVQELGHYVAPALSAVRHGESLSAILVSKLDTALRALAHTAMAQPEQAPLAAQKATQRACRAAQRARGLASELEVALGVAAQPVFELHGALQASVHAMSEGTPIAAAEEHAAQVQRLAGQGAYGSWGLEHGVLMRPGVS